MTSLDSFCLSFQRRWDVVQQKWPRTGSLLPCLVPEIWTIAGPPRYTPGLPTQAWWDRLYYLLIIFLSLLALHRSLQVEYVSLPQTLDSAMWLVSVIRQEQRWQCASSRHRPAEDSGFGFYLPPLRFSHPPQEEHSLKSHQSKDERLNEEI